MKMKKFLAMILSVALCLAYSTVSFADEASRTNREPTYELNNSLEDGNYFRFGGNKRINSDGTFTFNVTGTLKSSKFKVSDTSIQVYATANPVDSYFYGEPYYISLYKGNSLVKKVTYYCDGNEWGYEFTDLSTTATYTLRFHSNLFAVKGSGNITNYVHP